MQKTPGLKVKFVHGTLHAQRPEDLIRVADILRDAFSGYVSMSDVRPNREDDGYHLMVSIYLQEAR